MYGIPVGWPFARASARHDFTDGQCRRAYETDVQATGPVRHNQWAFFPVISYTSSLSSVSGMLDADR